MQKIIKLPNNKYNSCIKSKVRNFNEFSYLSFSKKKEILKELKIFLIEKKIFLIDKVFNGLKFQRFYSVDLSGKKTPINLFEFEIYNGKYTSFSLNTFKYNKKYYSINKSVINEAFNFLKDNIELTAEINAKENTQKVIMFSSKDEIKDEIHLINQGFKAEENILLFIGENKQQYNSWEEYVKTNFRNSLFLYLSQERIIYKEPLVAEWTKLSILTKIKEKYSEHIKSAEQSIIKTENPKKAPKKFKKYFREAYQIKYSDYFNYLKEHFTKFENNEKAILIYLLKKDDSIPKNNEFKISPFLKLIANKNSSTTEYIRKQFKPNTDHQKLLEKYSLEIIEEVEKKLRNIYFNIDIKIKATKQ